MASCRRISWVRLVVIILMIGASALAHHSFAVYDHSRTLNVTGTVTKWQWSNPHAYLDIDVKNAGGEVKHYTLEGTSINMLQRIGWHANTIKAGDEVKVIFAPLLSGQPGGVLLEIILPNGDRKELPIPGGNTFKRTGEQ